MSKTDRGALFALAMALLAIVLIAWSGCPANESKTTPNSTDIEQAQNEDVASLVSAIRDFNPWNDTYAQWIMAVLSIAATGASVWAVILVRNSLALTREATNAAVRSNDITKEIFASENRPWLRLGRPVIRIKDDESAIFFKIRAINIGKTPALSAEIHISATRAKIPVASVTAVEGFAAEFSSTGGWKNNQKVIFPDRDRYLIPMDGTDIEGAARGEAVRILYCVTYKASGLDRTLRTAGEAIISPGRIDSADHVDGDWFLVKRPFIHFGIAFAD